MNAWKAAGTRGKSGLLTRYRVLAERRRGVFRQRRADGRFYVRLRHHGAVLIGSVFPPFLRSPLPPHRVGSHKPTTEASVGGLAMMVDNHSFEVSRSWEGLFRILRVNCFWTSFRLAPHPQFLGCLATQRFRVPEFYACACTGPGETARLWDSRKPHGFFVQPHRCHRRTDPHAADAAVAVTTHSR